MLRGVVGKAIISIYKKHTIPGHIIRSVLSSFFFFFFVFFPLLRGRDGYIFFTRHIMRVRLLTIYMPHWHRAIYFIELLYRYPRRILKCCPNRSCAFTAGDILAKGNDTSFRLCEASTVTTMRLAILRLFGGLTAPPDSISVHIEPSHREKNPGSSVV